MHPEHLRALADERRGRLLVHAEQQRLIAGAAPSPPLARRRSAGLFSTLVMFVRRRRNARRTASRVLVLDERPTAPIVPLHQWREASAQTRFVGPGRAMTRPDRV